MDEKKHKLVIEGNAFYEIDLECQRKKEQNYKQNKDEINKKEKKQRQRG